DELAQHVRQTVLRVEFHVRAVRPSGSHGVEAGHLERGQVGVGGNRQIVDAAGAHARLGLRAEDDPLRMFLLDLLVAHGLVVETRNVHLVGETVLDGVRPTVERGSGRTRRVLLVCAAREHIGDLRAVAPVLLGNLWLTSHRLGCATFTSAIMLMDPCAAKRTPAVRTATCFPAASRIAVSTLALAGCALRFRISLFTETVALASDTSGVMTYV